MTKIKKLRQGYKIYFDDYPSVIIDNLKNAKELIKLRDSKKCLFIPWFNHTYYVVKLWQK